jgi:catechol 2,3-dioxygenase-like lactoylglutathione lyase family enzyme
MPAESMAARLDPVAALSHLALSVGSLAISERFYREVFGFAVSAAPPYRGTGRRLARLMEVPDCEISGLFLRKEDFFLERLEYQPAGRTRDRAYRDDEIGFAHLSFIVDHLDLAARAVERHGGQMHVDTRVDLSFGEGEPVTIAFCLDPDGNRIELVEHRDTVGRTKHADFLGASALGWPTPSQQLLRPAKIADPEWS